MGVIRKAYNLIMTLIGLAVICLVAFLFFVGKWEDHQEQEYNEDREEIVSSVAKAARERGLGDLDQLRQEYLGHCPAEDLSVFEGDAAEICTAMADALLAQSQKRQMTLTDFGELGYELCALNAKEEGEEPDDYCSRQDAIDDTLFGAIVLGLCDLDRARLVEPIYGNSVSKRGESIYISHERHVDCDNRVFKDWYYEGFFDSAPEDEEGPPILDRLYEVLNSEDPDAAIAVFDSHAFGENEEIDLWMLNMVLYNHTLDLLPEVLKRNGGKVNFGNDYYNQPLSKAIDNESPEAALALLEAGADPLRPHEYGQTPIVNAAGHGMLDVVKELVARGADVNGVVGSESLDFGVPLMWASMNSHEETALWLLDQGAAIAPEDPSDFPDWSNGRLLEYGATGGDLEVVRRMMEMGAESEESLDLIQGALAGGNPDVLLLLFDQGYELPGAKYHDRIYDDVVDVIQEENYGRIEDGVRMFEMLLGQGLDMSELRDSGWNYGHQAVIHYVPPVIRTDRDADRDAIVIAQRLRFVKRVIDEVLAAGIDIDHRYESQTMLMEAADGGQAEILRYLLDKGADANLRNEDGELALDIAVREGRRLMGFWRDHEALRRSFSKVVETLGGSAAMLDPE